MRRTCAGGGEGATWEVLLRRIVLFLAACTLLTHIAQPTGLPFRVYASVIAIAATGFVLEGAWRLFVRLRHAPPSADSVAVFAMMLLGALISVTVHRGDIDDYYYLPNLAHYLAQPASPMGYTVHWLVPDIGAPPVQSPIFSMPGAWEYLQAALAWTTGLPLLGLYYYAGNAVVAALIPLALYAAARSFSPTQHSAAIGTAVAILVVLLLGETHRTFGNFAFTRAWHGKTLVMAVLLPLGIAWAAAYARQPSWKHCGMLSALAISAVGCSSSGAILVPPLMIVVALASLSDLRVRPLAHTLLPAVIAVTYPVIYVGAMSLLDTTNLSNDSAANAAFPSTYWGHLALVFGGHPPLTAIAFGAGLVLSLTFGDGRLRRLIVIWLLILGLTLLNPLLAPFWIEHVTTANIYWRWFYLLPFPISLAWGAAWAWHRAGERRWRSTATVGVLTLLALPQCVQSLPTSLHYYTDWGLPRYKLDAGLLRHAAALADDLPAGPMLAPQYLGAAIYLRRPDCPQYFVRDEAERTWLASGELRYRACLFASGYAWTESASFIEFVGCEQTRMQTIVMRKDVAAFTPAVNSGAASIREWLRMVGYTESGGDDSYAVFTRR